MNKRKISTKEWGKIELSIKFLMKIDKKRKLTTFNEIYIRLIFL
jgi:hypothetical protein